MKAVKMATYSQKLIGRLLFLILLFLTQNCTLGATSSPQPTNSQQLTSHPITPQQVGYYDFTTYDTNTAESVMKTLITNKQPAIVRNLPTYLLQDIIDTNINKLIFSPNQFIHVQSDWLGKILRTTRVTEIRVEDPKSSSISHAVMLKSAIRGPITLYANK